MPVRSFTDSNGVRWNVWSTKPSKPDVISPELAEGWITFDSPGERRRLSPVPRRWEDASPEKLELMCRAATAAPRG
jgi:hypothetical protein